jgi:hypothetical protein
MHQVGELFIEAITEVAYDPVVAEASDQGRTERGLSDNLEISLLSERGGVA